MHSAVEEILYEGERLAANHARGHNLIHPEVAGDRTTRATQRPFPSFRTRFGETFYLLFLFLFHQLQIAVWVSDLSDRWFRSLLDIGSCQYTLALGWPGQPAA